MMRGATGLGPGPNSSLLADEESVGGIEKRADAIGRIRRKRAERRARIAAAVAGHVERGLEAGNAVGRRHRAAEWCDASLQRAGLVVAAGAHVREQLEARGG